MWRELTKQMRQRRLWRAFVMLAVVCCLVRLATSNLNAEEKRILIIAGDVTKIDTVGHHDYEGGCKCLHAMLEQNPELVVQTIEGGWPDDEKLLDQAHAIVFYTDGGGTQAFLSSADRVAKIDSLAKAGVGLVMIHQAVDFPDEFADEGKRWLGGCYLTGKSGRGHWDSSHVDFPVHPVTRGVTPWKINDGWLNGIQFVDARNGVTPLIWSGKVYSGSRAGLDPDIVAWTYERPEGGRSFSFTGLDAHAAWKEKGLRQLVVNGTLWTAGIDIPKNGAECEMDDAAIDSLLTPREAKPAKIKAKVEKK